MGSLTARSALCAIPFEALGQTPYEQEDWAGTAPVFGERPAAMMIPSMPSPRARGTACLLTGEPAIASA